jgi:hypothetical protein
MQLGVGGISDLGIRKVNLIKLNAENNHKITNLNHMEKTLKILYGEWDCGINDKGIKKLI